MKRTNILLSTFLLLFFSNLQSFGQIKSISNMLSGIEKDKSAVQDLIQAYLKPYANALGANLNGGWYNTAKVHKLGGFDLTFSVSASFVPSSDKTFDPSKILGSNFTVTPANSLAPTVAGENKRGPEISYNIGSTSTQASFYTPKGTGWSVVPSPMLQLGIGLIKGTDITVRYLPSFNMSDYGKYNMWGIGVKHSLKQWIPVIKMTPFFNLSIFGGYTKFTATKDLDMQQSFYEDISGVTYENPTAKYDNQKMELISKGFTGNIIASFDFPVIALYGGVGFSTTNTNLSLKGDYPIINDQIVVVKQTDPLNIEMKSTDGSKTKPRLNAGVRFKFAIITLHFDYTYANYSVATAGLGLSFR
jgi:hypothetical protein